MAMRIEPLQIGIDVSKDELVIGRDDQEGLTTIENTPESITAWLKTLPGTARIAVEATNVFHVELVERAHRRNHTVFVLDGYRLNRYRESVGGRAKTDAGDARLLLRYLDHEWRELRPWTPPPKGYRVLQRLINRRATLIQAKVALEQSLRALSELRPSVQALLRQMDRVDQQIRKQMLKVLRSQDWQADSARVQGIEGIAEITSAALVMVFRRGAFASSDAFIAFLGLDVRVRQSGKWKGSGKLTKKGSPELRRLLYLAAMTARRSPAWKDFYEYHLNRGRSKIQALVILARKLARVAFALLKNQTQYQPKISSKACIAT